MRKKHVWQDLIGDVKKMFILKDTVDEHLYEYAYEHLYEYAYEHSLEHFKEYESSKV